MQAARAEVSDSDLQLIQKVLHSELQHSLCPGRQSSTRRNGCVTCDCLGERIKAGDGLGTARETCTMEVTRLYPTSQS